MLIRAAEHLFQPKQHCMKIKCTTVIDLTHQNTHVLASYINYASKICSVQLAVLNAKRRHENETSQQVLQKSESRITFRFPIELLMRRRGLYNSLMNYFLLHYIDI